MDIKTTNHGYIRVAGKLREEWTAIDKDGYDGPGSPQGWGSSEAAAIADLRDQLADIEERRNQRLRQGIG